MNYSELVSSIETYTENTETSFVAEIPNFVKQAEDRIHHSVQLPEFKKHSTASMTASSQYMSAPTDFIAPYSMAVLDSSSVYYFLYNKDINFIREAYPDATTTGIPKYYSLWDDDTFIFAPTPDSTYTVELSYFYKPTSIVDSSTSWLGDNFPSVLLYGCLVEAYTFMKGEKDLLDLYIGRYSEALQRLKNLGDARDRKDAYRAGQLRMQET